MRKIVTFLVLLLSFGIASAQIQQPVGSVVGPIVNIKEYGATGDGTCHALSSVFSSLAQAQNRYPFASDLTQCMDWAATQAAINAAYLITNAGTNAAVSVYCPVGQYVLSNPLFVDQANNIQGSAAAWASGTTYANGAQVTYNGVPYTSQGAGNIGNAPTSVNFFPGTLQWNFNDTFPIKAVTISNASPAVITVPASQGGLVSGVIVANMPVIFMLPNYPVPGGSAPALPTGLSPNTVYYVVGSSITTGATGTFEVSATPGGAAINTSSAGVGPFFINNQVWQVVSNPSSSGIGVKVAFVGDEGVPSNTGCGFNVTGMWTNGAIYIGPQNGVLVKNISVQHHSGGGSTPPYRCNRWRGGTSNTFFSVHAGFIQTTNGGGSSRSLYEHVSAAGFFTDFAVGYNSGQLGDSNTFLKSFFTDACIGIEWMETQAFINSLYDTNINSTTTGMKSDLSEGVKVIGGNHSTITGIGNAFAITSVTLPTSTTLQATITSPDQYLLAPMCSINAGYALNQFNPHFGNSVPLGNSCGYNVFTIVTAHSGIVPFYVTSFNPITNVITLQVAPAYYNSYNGTYGAPSELTSATTLYAAEMGLTYAGQVQAEEVHLESAGIATTMICNCNGFGGQRAAEMKHVFLNNSISGGTVVCCNQSPSNLQKSAFYAQQTVPFINASFGDVIIDGMAGGAEQQTQANGPSGVGDRVLIGIGSSTYLEGRHSYTDSFVYPPGGPNFDFQTDSESGGTSIGGAGAQKQLSGGYFALGGGNSAFGAGLFDSPQWFLPKSRISNIGTSNEILDIASAWRTVLWGRAPTWGVRPAPWVHPCILPSQVTQLGSLPAITWTSQLQPNPSVSAGGSGYNINDTITLAGGTFSTAAQVKVTGTGGGGAVTSVGLTNTGSYTVEPASFTQGSTSGGGTGATFNNPIWFVNYNIPYPILWGGQIYSVCDYTGTSQTNYFVRSNHLAYSYFQNLTTTNVPNLSWTMNGGTPFVYMNQEALELMFPGLNIQLTPDGTGGCSATQETFQVLEVHPTMGYIKVINAGQDGTPYLPQWGSANTCKNTTIGQQSINLASPAP